MGSVPNTIDKFGSRRVKNQTLVLRGQQGIGFKLTPNGDLYNKRFTNVGESKDADDAATCKHLDGLLNTVIKLASTDLNTFIDKLGE